MTLSILHVASHAINVGDGALNATLHHRLRELVPGPVEITTADVAVGRTALTAADVEPFDLVLVGGGGGINDAPWNAATGTSLPMALDELRAAATPFAFVALGHNLFPGEALHRSALVELLAWCVSTGTPFSVRNDGSLDRLRRDLGDEAVRTVVEVADPGLFVRAVPQVPVEAGTDRFAVVQVAADKPALRFGPARPTRSGRRRWRRPAGDGDGAGALGSFLDDVAAFARHLVDERGLEVLLAPHVPADVVVGGEVFRRLPTSLAGPHGRRPFRSLGLPHPRHAERFFGTYAAAELVVGMRGHAVICGVGLGRPTVAVSTHPKVRGFMESVGRGAAVVEPGPGLLRSLVAVTDRALAAPAAAAAVAPASLADLRAGLDAFLLAALARAAGRVGAGR